MSETESLSELPLNKSNTTNSFSSEIPIEIEIVSEEEMVLLEAALALASASVPANASAICSPLRSFHGKARSIQSITVLSKRSLSGHTEPDIEDSGNFASTQKKNKNNESFLHRFRKKKGLSVTDITSTVFNGFVLKFLNFAFDMEDFRGLANGSEWFLLDF